MAAARDISALPEPAMRKTEPALAERFIMASGSGTIMAPRIGH